MSGVTQHMTDLTGSRSLNSSSTTAPQPSQPSPPAHPAQPRSPRTREVPYFLWTSVRVMPCSVTLKWTTVGVGRTSLSKVAEMAFSTARAPLRVSKLTELRYRAWQPEGRGAGADTALGPCQNPLGEWRSPRPCCPSAQNWGIGVPSCLGNLAGFLFEPSGGWVGTVWVTEIWG